MTEIPKLTPYSGTIPDKETQTKDEFANNVHPFMEYYDTTTVPEINTHRTAMNTLSGEINTAKDEIEVMKDEAETASDSAKASANYKGDWSDTYNSGNGYAQGDSVTYTDGNNYASKVDDNTEEPVNETSNDYWLFIESVGYKYSTIDANYTAVKNDYINLDSSGGSFTITLPATHSENDIVMINTGTSAETNSVTVDGNGSNILLLNESDTTLVLDKNGIELKFKSNGADWRTL